ncbi:hypothetical protein DXV75_13525 [Alteromonas aestuariivivens]|uniref:Uncharacterized protein n=1 Tax=Alteromonas aestuariivivens TaxID=1938339 RepID=A0A3D8M477_9ALTE|nr:hypothetical protein [Alteromonas aestuariivivens]RDV24441.1 hypothetical protein DXV75_13525 [Alteromonas aestuariivivens]
MKPWLKTGWVGLWLFGNLPFLTFAQQAPINWSVVHCMQSTSPEYVVFELDSWLPYHQQRVDNQEMVSWTLYGVLFGDRSPCDHVIIESFSDPSQVHKAYKGVAPGNDSEVNPMSEPEMIANTFSARKMMSSALWKLTLSSGMSEHNYMFVNWVRSTNKKSFLELQKNFVLQAHQRLMEQGVGAGFALYEHAYPTGQNVMHDFISLDYLLDLQPLQWYGIPELEDGKIRKQLDDSRTVIKNMVLVRIGGTR